MKNFLKVFILGLVLTGFTVGTAISVSAQDGTDEKATLYQKYTDNYAGTTEQRKIAVEAAKEYVKKYGSNADDAQIVDYLKGAIPTLEQSIKEDEAAAKRAKEDAIKNARYSAFNDAVKSKNWDAVYTTGQNILNFEPDMLDVILVLGSLGYDETLKNPPNNKFNDSTIKYAKMALDKLKNGAKSSKYGAYAWEYKNKENATGWMNYTIGIIQNLRQSDNDPIKKKEAIGYLYEATKSNFDKKEEPRIYGSIGDWYFSKAQALSVETDALIAKNKALVTKRNAAEASLQPAMDKEIDANEAKITDNLAMARGYADRAIDAYARAAQFAKKNPKELPAYRDAISSQIKLLYEFRYPKPEDRTDAKINSYVAGVTAKPMPDPSSEVTPVVVTKISTATSVTPSTEMPAKPAVTTPAKPAATTTTKPATPVKPLVTPAKKPATSSTVPAKKTSGKK